MAKKRPDSAPATEALVEIESVFDRVASWVTDHPAAFLASVGAVLAIAAGIGVADFFASRRADAASEAVAGLQRAFFEASGSVPGALEEVEPANPEVLKNVREEYLAKFLEAAEEHSGTVASVEALLEAGGIQARLGDRKAAIETWRRARAAAPRGSGLQALTGLRIAGGYEELGQWSEAAAAYEEASELDFPNRYHAMVDAARCYANAGDNQRAFALFSRARDAAPDLEIADYTRSRLAALGNPKVASADRVDSEEQDLE